MSMPIVVSLEAVQVEDHRDQLAAPSGRGKLAAEIPLELTPIGQARQWIRQRQRMHLLEEQSILDRECSLIGKCTQQFQIGLTERMVGHAAQRANGVATAE